MSTLAWLQSQRWNTLTNRPLPDALQLTTLQFPLRLRSRRTGARIVLRKCSLSSVGNKTTKLTKNQRLKKGVFLNYLVIIFQKINFFFQVGESLSIKITRIARSVRTVTTKIVVILQRTWWWACRGARLCELNLRWNSKSASLAGDYRRWPSLASVSWACAL